MRHAPLWVLSYRNKQRELRQLHSALKQQDASPVFDTSCKHIELHPMKFMTGQILYGEEEVGPMFTHFAPNPHVAIPDSLEDCFTKSRENRNTKSNNGDIITPNTKQLFESFERRSRISRPRPQQESRWYPASMWGKYDYLFNSNDTHGFTIESGATRTEATGCKTTSGHRLVVMKSDSLLHESHTSIGELVVLVNWMIAGFKDQTKPMRSKLGSLYNDRFNHDFPTMVISFLPDCHVRVLFGYFERSMLKVAYTKAIDFDTDDYDTNMRTLLQWAWPKVRSDTSKPVPLPTILEENEEEDKDDNWELEIENTHRDEKSGSHLETEKEKEVRKRKDVQESDCRKFSLPSCKKIKVDRS
ncbi:hypothetical protein N7452_003228 [Penicillium brevicompactum]|uniref:Uncharacterized protein n=1 Tax=Penicillium brevicompactum TaxID=5074 RepID=A0A9W9QUM8_PENBR|nr:hypothetical protein N7452_003228 [Penicillium brevicompactum]